MFILPQMEKFQVTIILARYVDESYFVRLPREGSIYILVDLSEKWSKLFYVVHFHSGLEENQIESIEPHSFSNQQQLKIL